MSASAKNAEHFWCPAADRDVATLSLLLSGIVTLVEWDCQLVPLLVPEQSHLPGVSFGSGPLDGFRVFL
jgi:hypothetical protein